VITWKKVAVKYGSWPLAGHVGSVEMFRIVDSMLVPDRKKPYWLFASLPGEKEDDARVYAATENELKAVAEEKLQNWLDKAGLMIKQEEKHA
jgi:hypothetical protein